MPRRPDGRRLEFVSGGSDKFWEWSLFERPGPPRRWELRFRWGRRGTTGQSMVEVFDDRRLAQWKADKREAEKRLKGYKVVLEMVSEESGKDVWKSTPSTAYPKPKPTVEVYPKAKPQAMPAQKPLAGVRRVRLRD